MPAGRAEEVEFAAPFIFPWVAPEEVGYAATEPAIAFRAGARGAALGLPPSGVGARLNTSGRKPCV